MTRRIRARNVLTITLVVVAALVAFSFAGVESATPRSRVTTVLHTPPGAGALVLDSFSGSEALSTLYEYRFDLVSGDPTIDPRGLIGAELSLEVRARTGPARHFSGLIAEFARNGAADRRGGTRYTAVVVPAVWTLTQTTDIRVFQDRSAPEVVAQVLAEGGIDGVEFRLDGGYPEHEYLVQYRETDFDFISRLMEEEGIFYSFEHDDAGHRLVIADGNDRVAPGPVPGDVTVDFDTWTSTAAFRPGRATLDDYDFAVPSLDLTATADAAFSPADPDRFELYDYPGEYSDLAEGARLARLRMEEAEVGHHVVTAAAATPGVAPGHVLPVATHPRSEEAGSYLVVSVRHSVRAANTRRAIYENEFVAIPAAQPFRPSRETPKPVVAGPQTAVVVGPSGEEIYTDEFGRVKVQFHWDREGRLDENSSSWIRVAQDWRDVAAGSMAIPRIGSEVVVEFLEGDADRPIVVGRVYNGEDVPPLPGAPPGGGPSG